MNAFEAILLGIVQGLTEFLPISSSGHLILVPWVGDIRYLQDHPDFNKAFDVALHLGTLVAVVAYFRHELVEIAHGAAGIARSRTVRTDAERLALAVGVATVPAVIVGGLGEGVIQDELGQPWQIAIFLAVFGLLLAWADRRPQRTDLEHIGPREALKIGLAQVLSLAPGVSRSGITITAGRFLGLDRNAAARFSFLLLTPVTAGAVAYEGLDLISTGLPQGQSLWPVVLGIVASAVSGFAAISVLLRYIRTHSYDAFVVYRLIVAAIVLLLIATGVREATF